MSGEMIAIVAVGATVAGVILTSSRGLRQDMVRLESRLDERIAVNAARQPLRQPPARRRKYRERSNRPIHIGCGYERFLTNGAAKGGKCVSEKIWERSSLREWQSPLAFNRLSGVDHRRRVT